LEFTGSSLTLQSHGHGPTVEGMAGYSGSDSQGSQVRPATTSKEEHFEEISQELWTYQMSMVRVRSV
jgi:hypothetical protein